VRRRGGRGYEGCCCEGRSNYNSIPNNNAHSKVRSDGKGKDRGRERDVDAMDVQAMDEQRLDEMRVSTSTARLEAGIREGERMTHGEDMKNGRERGKST